jgi:hypothetical protein
MAEQTTEWEVEGIDITIKTDGPESQDGHVIGSDVLHLEIKHAVAEVVESHV